MNKQAYLDAPKLKRTHMYCQKPYQYEMECPLCGKHNIEWSEFEDHIWCYDCEEDVLMTYKHSGIFSGPIPAGAAKMLGILFDRISMLGVLVPFNDDGKNTEDFNKTWLRDKDLMAYRKKLEDE